MPRAKGKDKKAEAFARFATLLGASAREPSPAPLPQPAPAPIASSLVTAYLKDIQGRIKPSTWIAYDCVLKPFVMKLGDSEAVALKASEVELWAS